MVVTNSSPMQQATQQDVMSSQLNPEASFFLQTPGVEQAWNIGPNNWLKLQSKKHVMLNILVTNVRSIVDKTDELELYLVGHP